VYPIRNNLYVCIYAKHMNMYVSYMTCKSAYKSTYMFVYVTCMFHIFCHILCIYEMFQFNIYTIYDIYVLSYYLDGDIYVADICNSIYSGIYVTPHIYAKIYDFFYMSHIFCSVWVFNKRRAEVKDLKVQDYLERPEWHRHDSGEMELALSPVDRMLAKRYKPIDIIFVKQ